MTDEIKVGNDQNLQLFPQPQVFFLFLYSHFLYSLSISSLICYTCQKYNNKENRLTNIEVSFWCDKCNTPQQQEYNENINQYLCPRCQSINIRKIGTLDRLTSVGFFGLASGKLGKTMECNDCKYKW